MLSKYLSILYFQWGLTGNFANKVGSQHCAYKLTQLSVYRKTRLFCGMGLTGFTVSLYFCLDSRCVLAEDC